MKASIKLFKALPVSKKDKKKPNKQLLEKTKLLLEKTLQRGFIFAPEVINMYSENELNYFISVIEEEIGLTKEQMNSSFHKSWGKIKDATMTQLVIEQILHYITTYGFEELGIYNKDSVYIPNEKLEIPELKEGINIVVIKGYTKEETKEKLLNMLQSGIALNEDTMKDVIDIISFVNLNDDEIENIKNKEIKITLYDQLNMVPKNPVEFLRYIIYKSIDKTLLIKDKDTIEKIKIADNSEIINLFVLYKSKYGLEKLAEIFYRFKPLFLAFRTNMQLKNIINQIRRLAKKYHKPMPKDYLNEVTAKIKKGEKIKKEVLENELNKVNIFRKIRLAYALKFRTKNVDSILYKIRNGKGYAKTIDFFFQDEAKRVLKIVKESIIKDITKNVKDKKIYIPDYIKYTLPATEKQFTGYFPSGSYINVSKDIIVGIHWKNVERKRIDLDLSLINSESGKIGWDENYRTEDRSILYSGDMTNASGQGASELFYVKKQEMEAFIMLVNFYNYDKDKYLDVPFKIIVGKEQVNNFKKNYIINPNNVISIAKSSIDNKQKVLGLLVPSNNGNRFYFTETYLGLSISSSESEVVENAKKYLLDFYQNTISLNDILVKAGANIVEDKLKCDIDLSPEKLEKDTILNLLL